MITNPLTEQSHRPWPVPPGPWMMRQQWCDLLFAHWPIAPERMRALVPPALELDLWEGQAWIGVVPFRMQDVSPRAIPALPWLSAFPELNVRTYVTMVDRGIVKSGVYFFSLEAANPVAVAIARSFFKLPYFNAAMHLYKDGDTVHYTSHRTHRNAPAAEFCGTYAPAGPIYRSVRGTIDYWLTERYALYTTDQRGQVYIGEIHHVPWPLQPATASFTQNEIAAASDIALPSQAPLLHFAQHLDVIVWPLRKLAPAATGSPEISATSR